MNTTHTQRFNNAKMQEKTVAEHFTNHIRNDKDIKNIIIGDLLNCGKKFSQEDFDRIEIKPANNIINYDVDLAGFIDGQLIFQIEVKTIIFDESRKNMCKRPVIPITLEAGKCAIDPSRKFSENGLVNFYNESKIKKVPLYIIVYDEHAYLSGKKSKDYFYFYDAETTAKFIDVINLFFGIARSFPKADPHQKVIEETIKKATEILCEPRGIPIPTNENDWNQLFRTWSNGVISFFPGNCGIFPTKTFS